MDYRAVRQIRERQESMRWLVEQAQKWPLGMIPIATASRVLGVSQERVHGLIREGKLTRIQGMPHGLKTDAFVPVIELIDAPFRGNRGEPGKFGKKNKMKEKEAKYWHDKYLREYPPT